MNFSILKIFGISFTVTISYSILLTIWSFSSKYLSHSLFSYATTRQYGERLKYFISVDKPRHIYKHPHRSSLNRFYFTFLFIWSHILFRGKYCMWHILLCYIKFVKKKMQRESMNGWRKYLDLFQQRKSSKSIARAANGCRCFISDSFRRVCRIYSYIWHFHENESIRLTLNGLLLQTDELPTFLLLQLQNIVIETSFETEPYGIC